jgi:hypothetical protein
MNDTKNPTKWLTELLEEARSFDGTMFPPTEKVEEGETVVDVCPDALRPYWAYARYCEREMKQAKVEMEFTSSEDEKAALLGKVVDMSSRYNTLNYIFWSCMNEFLSTWADPAHLRLRAEWKVITKDCSHSDGPEAFFRRIFGQ